MAGTREGGLKAAATNKARYGENYYEKTGRKGGKVSRGGGFADEYIGKDGMTGRERAAVLGQKGGRASRRSPRVIRPTEGFQKYILLDEEDY